MEVTRQARVREANNVSGVLNVCRRTACHNVPKVRG